jgi:hypothetical protein
MYHILHSALEGSTPVTILGSVHLGERAGESLASEETAHDTLVVAETVGRIDNQ